MTFIMELLLYTIQSFCLLSFAVCLFGLDYGLIIFRGRRTFNLTIKPVVVQHHRGWDTAGPPPILTFLWDILRTRGRGGPTFIRIFLSFRILLKFYPYQNGTDWMQLAMPNILFKRTPLRIPTAAHSLFFILIFNCPLGILLKLKPYQCPWRHWLFTTGYAPWVKQYGDTAS